MIRRRKRQGKAGWKVDREATLVACFLDPRSFVSTDGHWLLYGADKAAQRKRIFQRAKGHCQLAIPGVCRGWATEYSGEWDHIRGKGVKRCDCLGDGVTHGGRAVCLPCHRYVHVHPRFGEKESQ